MTREFKGVWIPKELYLDRTLSWTEKLIFIEIHSFTSKDMDCYFTNEYLADFLGISVPQVSRLINSLKDKGWIEQTKFTGRKRFLRSLAGENFLPSIKNKAASAEALELHDQNDKADSAKSANPSINKQSNIQDNTNREVWFESLWNEYPNRQGKKQALRHFLASVKTEKDLANIKQALIFYLASATVKRGFIKNGSTWFNQWQDWSSPTLEMMKGANSNGKEKSPTLESTTAANDRARRLLQSQ